jgi:hypothetical protein
MTNRASIRLAPTLGPSLLNRRPAARLQALRTADAVFGRHGVYRRGDRYVEVLSMDDDPDDRSSPSRVIEVWFRNTAEQVDKALASVAASAKFIADMEAKERARLRRKFARVRAQGGLAPWRGRLPTKLRHDGALRTIAEWAQHAGIAEHVLRSRLRLGWDLGKALSTPVRAHRPYRLWWHGWHKHR